MSKPTSVTDALSKMSGLSKETIRDIWAEVDENNRKLEGCAGPHDFNVSSTHVTHHRYTCSKCGGTVGAREHFWYKRGLDHGRTS